MAAILLVDGVSWGHRQQVGASASLSSLHRPDHCAPSPSSRCSRFCEPSTSKARCAISNDFLDRLDPPLPRVPDHYTKKHPGELEPQLILEMRPTSSQQPYHTKSLDTLVEPSLQINGNTSSQRSGISDGQEVDIKQNKRASPSYLSLSQSRRAMTTGAVLQAASSPLQTKELKGTTGFYVGFATVVLGLMAVLQKGGLLGNTSAPTTICTTCYGYGRRACNLCKGSGTVSWEGKLKHTDVCPSCLGTRIKKCSDCGGYRMRNDVPPFLQQLSKARS